MADPTIQTFCCHHANGTDMAVTIMEEFNTDAYNAVCMFSSSLGILGAIYQVIYNLDQYKRFLCTNFGGATHIYLIAGLNILPRQEFSNSHRWLSFSAARGRRIIVWLALADLLAAIGVFTRSTIWINFKNIMPTVDDDSSVLFCVISSAFIQYFYTATWIWTLCYAIDMRFVLSEKEPKTKYYHVTAWILPAISTTIGLSLLYYPDANCHTSKSLKSAIYRILPNYLASYIPILIVMMANPYLYCLSTKDMEQIITSTSGQFTSREREILDAIKIKFSAINLVFYICWLPNLVNGILLWTLWFHLPDRWIITIWYIMALLNPLQALFNCMVYRRWRQGSEKVVFPWRKEESPAIIRYSQITSSHSSVREEIYPLLQAQSINGFKNYS